ncbi:MAG TPA: PSD1 and planctomycete cytochrome C domain-containing protein [Pirellulales bacterium]|nr:PSD1 and planctomycete cytochrome C domain-containing protein [Pirellulales bacterium]
MSVARPPRYVAAARRGVSSLAVAILFVCQAGPLAAEEAASNLTPAATDFFETKIRPVLVQECYQCHSAQAAAQKKLKGGLLLDTRDASRKGGESGPAVVPGKPDESLLVRALRHEDFEMPPKGKLPDAVIADFVKWIEMGAPDPRSGPAAAVGRQIDIAAGRQFWSLKRFAAVTPPEVADRDWPRTPIDRFIRAKQEPLGLKPNGMATARVLIRRAYFDLTGLPPSPEEMEHWRTRLTGSAGEQVTDLTSYAELIDHLLASEHFGERWARHWMDVARFAESHGYEQDYDRPTAFYYRDFLIKAFNADLPYDQFVRWQLAGDELAPHDPLAWMATGFLGAGAFPTQLTEAEFESARYDELDDMVATTSVAFLGLSVGCARCHDHKFDPIRNDDYYRLASSFTTTIRSEIELDLQPQDNTRRKAEYAAKLADATGRLAQFERDVLPEKFREWLAAYDPASQNLAVWEVLEGQISSAAGSRFDRQADGSYLAQGAAPPQEAVTFVADTRRTAITAVRVEALADNSLPQKGPGRAPNGNFVLSDFQVTAQSADGIGQPIAIKLIAAQATHQQNDNSLSVAASIDGDAVSGWAVDGQIGRDQAAVFRLQEPVGFEGGTRLNFKLAFNHPNPKHSLGRFRLSATRQADAPPSVGNSGPDAKVVDALARLKQTPATDGADWQAALAWYKTTLDSWKQLDKGLADLRKAGPGLQLAKVLVASEGLPHLPHHADDRGFPHFYPETYFLRRGDVNQKGDVAKQGFLPVLLHEADDGSRWETSLSNNGAADSGVLPNGGSSGSARKPSFRRSRLAAWMTDVEHGAGQLAARVIVNRLWQHHFGRGLVATPNDFGASGERPSHPELLDWLAQDLVSHGWQLKRLHKLMMTSAVYLQSADFDEGRAKIDRENTYHWRRVPRRLEAEAIRDALLSVSGQLDPAMYGPGTLDPNMRRRSVYFFIKRSQLIGMMMLFDWPEHLVSIGQRSSTTIAPQALLFMNSPQERSYAQAFGRRLQEMSDDAFVPAAYGLAFGRQPDEKELALAREFLAKQAAVYTAAGQGDAAHLARVDFCQALVSMNEFVYVE